MPPIERTDLDRLEAKVDRLADAIEKLVLIEERQTTQGHRLGQLEQRLSAAEKAQDATDRKVDTWINRGIGVWAVVAAAFAAFKAWR